MASGPLVRVLARRRRDVRRYRIRLPRNDQPTLEEVVGMLSAWHRQVQRKHAIARWFCGQPHLALETVSQPAGNGFEVVNAVVCEPRIAASLDAAIRAAYPNARLGHDRGEPIAPADPPDLDRIGRHAVRLVKRRPPVYRAFRAPERESGESLVDAALAAAQSGQGAGVMVQIRLQPTSRLAEWRHARRVRAAEGRIERERALTASAPGLTGRPLARRELEGALDLALAPLFRTEVWVMSDHPEVLQAVAAVYQAGEGENPLDQRQAWSPLHRARAARGLPGLLSPQIFGVAEIAQLWSLPGLAAPAEVTRHAAPRLPIPAAIAVATPAEGAWGVGEGGRGFLLRRQEKYRNCAVVGVQGTGKTSLMVRSAIEDARDPDCCLIVIDPKSDLSAQLLSALPPEREVWYLRLSEPEFGINPLEADVAPDVVADAIVSALRDVNEDRAIQASSERFFRTGIPAVMLYAAHHGLRPNFWMLSDLLQSGRSAQDLQREVAAIARRSTAREHLHLARFFGVSLPEMYQSAHSQTALKSEAPANKVQLLLTPMADRFLHHPVQVRLEEIIRRRAVLVVDGSMGQVGADLSVKLLQILMRLLYAALQRQQELPAPERVRVCLKVDEAHFVLNEAFAQLIAVGRSAGLEVVAGWQYDAQFSTDRVLAAALRSLMQQRFIFRCDPADAREAATALMDAHTDVIRDDPQSRRALAVLPDTITHLPQYCGIASIDAQGQRQRPFAFWTLPTPVDEEALVRRRAAQREREVGGLRPHFPPDLAGVQGILAPQGVRYDTGTHHPAVPARSQADAGPPESPSPARGRPAPSGGGPGGTDDPRPEPVGEQLTLVELAPAAWRVRGPRPDRAGEEGGPGDVAGERSRERDSPSAGGAVPRRPALAPGGDPRGRQVGAPESYTELDRLREGAWHWEAQEVLPRAERGRPTRRQAEIMGLLCEAPLLLQSQIARELGLSESQALRALAPMRRCGWVKRCRPREKVAHGVPWVYALTAAGARVLGELGLSRPAAKGWREPSPEDLERRRWVPAHDAGAAAWVFALRRVLGPSIALHLLGPRSEAALPQPPTVRERGGTRRTLTLEEVPLPMGYAFANHDPARPLRGFRADWVVDLLLGPREDDPGERRRVDLFVEYDRAQKRAANREKLLVYQQFLCGWHRMLARYEQRSTPAVVFVCPDEPRARELARRADALLAVAVAAVGEPPASWRYVARECTYFVAERDIHEDTPRAWRVPDLPPEVRAGAAGDRDAHPVEVDLVDPGLRRWAGL